MKKVQICMQRYYTLKARNCKRYIECYLLGLIRLGSIYILTEKWNTYPDMSHCEKHYGNSRNPLH